MAGHDIDRSLVEAIAQIDESTGIRTAAECVDSADALTRPAEVGIEYAHGHYIGAPQPAEMLEVPTPVDATELRLRALGNRSSIPRPDPVFASFARQPG